MTIWAGFLDLEEIRDFILDFEEIKDLWQKIEPKPSQIE